MRTASIIQRLMASSLSLYPTPLNDQELSRSALVLEKRLDRQLMKP